MADKERRAHLKINKERRVHLAMNKKGISEVIFKPMRLDDFSKVIRRVLDDNNIITV